MSVPGSAPDPAADYRRGSETAHRRELWWGLGLGIAGLILARLFPLVGVGVAIAALVFGITALRRDVQPRGVAILDVVLGGIGTLASLLFGGLWVVVQWATTGEIGSAGS